MESVFPRKGNSPLCPPHLLSHLFHTVRPEGNFPTILIKRIVEKPTLIYHQPRPYKGYLLASNKLKVSQFIYWFYWVVCVRSVRVNRPIHQRTFTIRAPRFKKRREDKGSPRYTAYNGIGENNTQCFYWLLLMEGERRICRLKRKWGTIGRSSYLGRGVRMHTAEAQRKKFQTISTKDKR